ncbi:hypothetical protein BCR37DRAFT_352426 [Protomyces lactucae-debilis]|uniref:FAD-binding FR-type domain-containing protein n=1 Tax=Protomyces lactucae-debilis TaxID=2754530 RepID=A0A1Y2ETC5_PROLT|nr:uncharacterized protein BCR37DRAFT_352426 [Protomyces lactucae-debilis]ORY74813.1 hypothetical protein BCR37DRAFT_352426 [Protomyces lactucae-debilis]
MRPVASISVCDPSLNIQRPYTVLSHDAEQGILSILVKRYDDGDMSRFIHGKRVGGTLQLRAHPSAYIMPDYQARGIQQVMCVVGGTGVVVAIQLAEALLKQADTMPRVGIVYASRCRQERVLQDRLDAIVEQSNGHVTVRYVEDDTEGFVSQKHLQDALGLKSGWFKQPTADGNTTHVIVCGSDGFVAHIAGYKPERGQGEVGGLLAQMHLTQSVWKL